MCAPRSSVCVSTITNRQDNNAHGSPFLLCVAIKFPTAAIFSPSAGAGWTTSRHVTRTCARDPLRDFTGGPTCSLVLRSARAMAHMPLFSDCRLYIILYWLANTVSAAMIKNKLNQQLPNGERSSRCLLFHCCLPLPLSSCSSVLLCGGRDWLLLLFLFLSESYCSS